MVYPYNPVLPIRPESYENIQAYNIGASILGLNLVGYRLNHFRLELMKHYRPMVFVINMVLFTIWQFRLIRKLLIRCLDIIRIILMLILFLGRFMVFEINYMRTKNGIYSQIELNEPYKPMVDPKISNYFRKQSMDTENLLVCLGIIGNEYLYQIVLELLLLYISPVGKIFTIFVLFITVSGLLYLVQFINQSSGEGIKFEISDFRNQMYLSDIFDEYENGIIIITTLNALPVWLLYVKLLLGQVAVFNSLHSCLLLEGLERRILVTLNWILFFNQFIKWMVAAKTLDICLDVMMSDITENILPWYSIGIMVLIFLLLFMICPMIKNDFCSPKHRKVITKYLVRMWIIVAEIPRDIDIFESGTFSIKYFKNRMIFAELFRGFLDVIKMFLYFGKFLERCVFDNTYFDIGDIFCGYNKLGSEIYSLAEAELGRGNLREELFVQLFSESGVIYDIVGTVILVILVLDSVDKETVADEEEVEIDHYIMHIMKPRLEPTINSTIMIRIIILNSIVFVCQTVGTFVCQAIAYCSSMCKVVLTYEQYFTVDKKREFELYCSADLKLGRRNSGKELIAQLFLGLGLIYSIAGTVTLVLDSVSKKTIREGEELREELACRVIPNDCRIMSNIVTMILVIFVNILCGIPIIIFIISLEFYVILIITNNMVNIYWYIIIDMVENQSFVSFPIDISIVGVIEGSLATVTVLVTSIARRISDETVRVKDLESGVNLPPNYLLYVKRTCVAVIILTVLILQSILWGMTSRALTQLTRALVSLYSIINENSIQITGNYQIPRQGEINCMYGKSWIVPANIYGTYEGIVMGYTTQLVTSIGGREILIAKEIKRLVFKVLLLAVVFLIDTNLYLYNITPLLTPDNYFYWFYGMKVTILILLLCIKYSFGNSAYYTVHGTEFEIYFDNINDKRDSVPEISLEIEINLEINVKRVVLICVLLYGKYLGILYDIASVHEERLCDAVIVSIGLILYGLLCGILELIILNKCFQEILIRNKISYNFGINLLSLYPLDIRREEEKEAEYFGSIEFQFDFSYEYFCPIFHDLFGAYILYTIIANILCVVLLVLIPQRIWDSIRTYIRNGIYMYYNIKTKYPFDMRREGKEEAEYFVVLFLIGILTLISTILIMLYECGIIIEQGHQRVVMMYLQQLLSSERIYIQQILCNICAINKLVLNSKIFDTDTMVKDILFEQLKFILKGVTVYIICIGLSRFIMFILYFSNAYDIINAYYIYYFCFMIITIYAFKDANYLEFFIFIIHILLLVGFYYFCVYTY